MAQKIKCKICGKNFKAEEGLEMHAKAKHLKREEKPAIGRLSKQEKIRNAAILLIVILIAGLGLFFVIEGTKDVDILTIDFKKPLSKTSKYSGCTSWHPNN